MNALFSAKNRINESLKWGQNFSLFKMGFPPALDYWETVLTARIIKKLGKKIQSSPDEWVVIVKKLWTIPSSASLLAKRISSNLKISNVYIETLMPDSKLGEGYYATLSNKKERLRALQGKITLSNSELVKGKKIIFIDDSYLSGITLGEIKKTVMNAHANSFHSFLLADLSKVKDYSQEDVLNRAALHTHDKVTLFLKVLNNRKVIYTAKLICYISELKNEELKKMCDRLTDTGKVNLYFYTILKKKWNVLSVLLKSKLKNTSYVLQPVDTKNGDGMKKIDRVVRNILITHNFKIAPNHLRATLQHITKDLHRKAVKKKAL